MGKSSIKENKNLYQTTREKLNLTRAQASELLVTLSEDKIEKIENERAIPHPDDILVMAKGYKTPELCNYYCSKQCPIGEVYVPEIAYKENIHEILVNMVVSLETMNQKKSRLMEILADGCVEDDEIKDFKQIQAQLEQISMTVEALQLWCEKMVAQGKMDLK